MGAFSMLKLYEDTQKSQEITRGSLGPLLWPLVKCRNSAIIFIRDWKSLLKGQFSGVIWNSIPGGRHARHTWVSKTFVVGSNPTAPAKQKRLVFRPAFFVSHSRGSGIRMGREWMTAQWAVRAALTDERRARRKNPTAPARRELFWKEKLFFYFSDTRAEYISSNPSPYKCT